MTRVLLAITVYNGEAFVPRTLTSAKRLSSPGVDLDVLVLDDASPAPGWSERLEALCADHGFAYYCSPRNLGIPRNVNLGLTAALEGDYDHVIISNSDVIYPENFLTEMLLAVAHPRMGSVTAWSNNVSVYSVPNADPDTFLADQDVVDAVSRAVASNFSGSVMDIPAGISFAIIIPTPVLREVGLMDPVFGRGYCEETDWSLRSLQHGYRIGLATAAFVYHRGGGSNVEAGLLSAGETTVQANEDIIDLRYPQFRTQVDAFMSSGLLTSAHHDALVHILRDAARTFGYTIEVGWLDRPRPGDERVRCLVAPQGAMSVRVEHRGFGLDLAVEGHETITDVTRNLFGTEPSEVVVYDHHTAGHPVRLDGPPSSDHYRYPTRV